MIHQVVDKSRYNIPVLERPEASRIDMVRDRG